MPAWVVHPVSHLDPGFEHERSGERLSRSRPQIPAAELRRADRAGGDGAHPVECDRDGAGRPCLYPDRRTRGRQDDHRADHCARLELRRQGWRGRADDRTVRRMRALPGHRRGPPCRRDRDGRGLAHRRRRYPRTDRWGALPAGLGALQDLHHRRSAHALEKRLQRVVEDARRAATRRDLRVRDDRNPQGAGDRIVALPAVFAAAGTGGSSGRSTTAGSPRWKRSRPSPRPWP